MLAQYAAILTAQAVCYETLARGERLSGSLDRDLEQVRPRAMEMFRALAAVAPAEAMRGAPADAPGIEALLRSGWHTPDMPFLARIVLQPYAEAVLAVDGGRLERRDLGPKDGRVVCPSCGSPPQVGVLRGETEGGGRATVCATCSATWTVPRIVCVACGEEDEHRLGYFRAPELAHVRVDTCETCRCYIKTVDLTRLGLAVPVVDEVASAVLDLWAAERRYTKVTRNLIGL